MTAPTSDRAQRIDSVYREQTTNIANSLWHFVRERGVSIDPAQAIYDAIVAVVRAELDARKEADAPDTERLGGGERATKDERNALKLIADTLTEVAPGWLIMSDAIRTLAQTAKDATARAEATEAANMELDKERRSCDQSARDLRAENARLRAQLDAMTGEQVPYMTVLDHSKTERIPLYRHPSPAARVVGEMLVVQKGEMRTVSSTWNDEMLTTPPDVGTYRLSITPNADGQTARVDEVSDTANGLRHVARGPNSPQGAVAYGRTAKDATQLLDTIRQHKSTPNADGAK